jgi:hypothetical protein
VNLGTQQWNRALWNEQKNIEKQFKFGDFFSMVSKGE